MRKIDGTGTAPCNRQHTEWTQPGAMTQVMEGTEGSPREQIGGLLEDEAEIPMSAALSGFSRRLPSTGHGGMGEVSIRGEKFDQGILDIPTWSWHPR